MSNQYERNYQRLADWFTFKGYTCVWEGSVNNFKIECYTNLRFMVFILRYKDGGFEVLTPTKSVFLDGVIEEIEKRASEYGS